MIAIMAICFVNDVQLFVVCGTYLIFTKYEKFYFST